MKIPWPQGPLVRMSSCNGGFETGDLTGWTAGGGYWYGSPVPPVDPTTYASGTPNNTIMSVGNCVGSEMTFNTSA